MCVGGREGGKKERGREKRGGGVFQGLFGGRGGPDRFLICLLILNDDFPSQRSSRMLEK